MDVLTRDTCKWCFSVITQTFSDFTQGAHLIQLGSIFRISRLVFSSISSYLPLRFSWPFLFFPLYPDVFMAFILSDRGRLNSSNFNFIRSFIARNAMKSVLWFQHECFPYRWTFKPYLVYRTSTSSQLQPLMKGSLEQDFIQGLPNWNRGSRSYGRLVRTSCICHLLLNDQSDFCLGG